MTEMNGIVLRIEVKGIVPRIKGSFKVKEDRQTRVGVSFNHSQIK